MNNIIEKKKNKMELTKEEIEYAVEGYTNGSIPDYQMSALLMAIRLNDMTDRETSYLTEAIVKSGEELDLSIINGTTVDKHSTGGVGDKTTIIILPIVAALGGKVVKISGRSLGFTGGTADKLESIPGFKVEMSKEKILEQVNEIGTCLVTQMGNLAPADKKMYALRDVTSTVDSVPLIASSVMSKKIATGAECIVLDVKAGKGAFMKTKEEAIELAEKMVAIGKNENRKIIAMVTNMDIPLGNAIGNSLEVKEAIEVLNGKGPEDLTKICIELATQMLVLSTNEEETICRVRVEESLKNGTALEKLREIIVAQGGDANVIENPDIMPVAKYKVEIVAKETGYISKIDAEELGKISVRLGAGRLKKEDVIDYSAGIVLNVNVCDKVEKGQLLATLYSNSIEKIELQKDKVLNAIELTESAVDKYELIYKIIK